MMKKWESKKNNNKCCEEIVVNNEHTKYPVIPNVCATLGWKTCNGDTGQRKLDWDIYWTDYGLGIERIVRRAHSYQRINHIPGMINIYRKNNLARALGRMQKLFGDTYDFFPKTWILPHEYNAVKEFLTSRPDRCVIIKPAGSAQGKGIYLALTPNMIQRSNDEMIAQEYVMKPLTIDGKKFDIRVYCLVTSVEPLRILVYNEGLVRLCTASYNVPDTSNVYDSFMHLTNYAVNKYNSNFVQSNDTANSEDVSNKRSLSWLWKWMDEQGMNHVPIWRGICDIIVKTLLSTQSYLSRAYGACKMSAQDKNPFTCFEILGFDILLTDALVPILLEVNHTPSFRMDSKLDERIKTGLVLDTMRLLNVNVGERTRYYIHKAAISQVRLYGSTFDELGDEKRRMGPREMSTESYWKKYKENERQYLGNFALIYPTDDYPHQPTRGMQKVYDHVLAAANALISVSGGVYSFFNVDDIMPMPSTTTPTIATPTTTPTTISTPSATAKKAPSSPTTVMPLLSLTLPSPASSSAAAASLSSLTHGISVPSHHHYRSDSNNSSNSNNNSSPNSSRNSHDTEDGTRPSGDEEMALGQVVISRRSHQHQSPGPGQGGQSQSQGQGQLIGPQGGGFNGMRGGVSFSSPVSAQIAAAAVTTLSSSASEKLTASMMMMHHHGMTPQPPGQGLGQGPGLGQGSSPRRIVTHSNVTNVSQSLHSSGSASSSSSSPPPTLQPATPTALAVSISSEKYHSYHHHPHLASIIINNKNNTSLPPPLAGQSPGLGKGPKLGLLGGLEGLGPLVSAACGIAATWGWAPGQGLGQKPGGLPGSQPSSSPCPFDDGPASTLAAAAAAAAAAHTQRLGQTLTTTPPRHPQSSHPPRPTSPFDVTPIPIPSHHRHCSDEVKDHSMNENLANATSAISAAVVAMACAPPTHAKPSRSVTSRGQSSSPLRFPLR